MIDILFASSNPHKIEEIKAIVPSNFNILSLKDIGFTDEIPETAETIEGNAIQKATYLSKQLDIPCFADDTGLCIPILDGKPGVYSARFAGPQKNSVANMELVLKMMADKNDREAYFETVIALYHEEKIEVFSGKIHGKITENPVGTNGFGYDPIFQPDGFNKTFAEMNSLEKNKISHRKLALEKLIEHLKNK